MLLTNEIGQNNEIITLLTKFGFGINVIRCQAFLGQAAENLIMVPERNKKYLIFSNIFIIK